LFEKQAHEPLEHASRRVALLVRIARIRTFSGFGVFWVGWRQNCSFFWRICNVINVSLCNSEKRAVGRVIFGYKKASKGLVWVNYVFFHQKFPLAEFWAFFPKNFCFHIKFRLFSTRKFCFYVKFRLLLFIV
jgi:hypothetical protein